MQIELYRDLESFNTWAMRKVFELCRRVDNAALLASYPLGPGNALEYLKLCARVERFWLYVWLSKKWDANWKSPDTIDSLEEFFTSIASERTAWLESNPNLLSTEVSFTNLQGVTHRQKLGDLVLNVLNGAVYARSQMLYFLKQGGQTVAGGLDYIFYRVAAPTILLQPKTVEACRQWGLEVGDTATAYTAPDLDSLVRYAAYGDWATQLLCNQALYLSDEQLDREWGMGIGTIRKTLLHLYDAECFWQANWEHPGSAFNHSPPTTSITEVSEKWVTMAANRTRKTLQMGASRLGDTVCVDFGGGPLEFRFSESLIQLAVHGTLHRLQLNSMLWSSGRQPQAIDYLDWLHTVQ